MINHRELRVLPPLEPPTDNPINQFMDRFVQEFRALTCKCKHGDENATALLMLMYNVVLKQEQRVHNFPPDVAWRDASVTILAWCQSQFVSVGTLEKLWELLVN